MTPTAIPAHHPAHHPFRSRRGGMLAAATLLVGALAAWAALPAEPVLRDVMRPVQLAMSVLLPCLGVLAVTDMHRPGPSADRRLAPRLLPVFGWTVGCALAGALLAAAATGWAGGRLPPASQVAALVAGAVLVQTIAQLTGVGWGLLVRRPILAMAATVVVPMSVTALLGAVDSSGGLVRWLTPYGNAQVWLAGTPTPGAVGALGVVAVLWCVVPNAIGARRINRGAPA